MKTEFEAKVLEIDVDDIKKKLEKLCPKEHEMFFKRWVFDIDSDKFEWIRLRSNGTKNTITYKCRHGKGISDTEELEIEVSDFDEAFAILSKLNFKKKFYQESRRIQFLLDDLEINIDTWPRIPTYLEIEGPSEERVLQGLAMIGLEEKHIGNPGVIEIYGKYGIDLHSFKELRFEK